jgi:hypothetical protein
VRREFGEAQPFTKGKAMHEYWIFSHGKNELENPRNGVLFERSPWPPSKELVEALNRECRRRNMLEFDTWHSARPSPPVFPPVLWTWAAELAD